MKYLALLAASVMFSSMIHAQQNILVKKWFAGNFASPDGKPDPADMNKQIKTLDITSGAGDTYTGNIEFGPAKSLKTQPCTISLSGNNISIETPGQKWTGEKLESGSDKMTLRLGSLVYYFSLITTRRRLAAAPPKFAVSQFYGSWQETGRTDKNKKNVAISARDTLYMRVSPEQAMLKWGSPMSGSFEISGDNITIAASDFKVVSLTEQAMVLDDYNMLHSFVKTTEPFAYEKKSSFMSNAVIDLTPGSLINNWFLFRIAPEAAGDRDNAINALNIISKNADNTFSGSIEFGNLIKKNYQTLPCKLTFTGNNLVILAGPNSWAGQVYQANGDTLVFGRQNEQMMYFVKTKQPGPVVSQPGKGMIIDLRPESLKKNWNAYKTESPSPEFIKPDMWLIKKLNITESLGNMKYNGKVSYYHRGGTYTTDDCTIEFSQKMNPKDSGITARVLILTTNGSNLKWDTEVKGADGNEMILGDKSIGIRYSFNVMPN